MKILRILTTALLVGMSLLTVYCLGTQVDGGRMYFQEKLTPAQGQALAEVIGFELAPGETIELSCEFYHGWKDNMLVFVNGIVSDADFLSRVHADVTLMGEYLSHYTYALDDNSEITLTVNGSPKAWFEIEEPAGKPALALAKEFIGRNNPLDALILHFPIILLIGWPIVLIPFIILRRKAKKEKPHENNA